MPDLSDTKRKCRIGTAKFFTLLLLLYHISVKAPETLRKAQDGKMRVAAYCRVSTDSEEQLNSYEAQKSYYTQKIQDSPDWEMAGIYADEGITGTSLKK